MRFCALLTLMGVSAGLVPGCDFQQMHRTDADQAIEHYVRGADLADRGHYELALTELNKAVVQNPSLSVAHVAMGDIHRKRGSHQLAAHSYKRACSANPYSFGPHYKLGVTYQLLADAASSLQELQTYLRDAIGVYLRALTIKPDDFDANLNISACYFQLRKFDLAEHYCKRAIQIQPDSAEAYSNLGIIYDCQNRYYEAINAYNLSLEHDVHQPQVLMNLGSAYQRQGRLKPALRTYEIVAEEKPDWSAPWEQIGACHYQMSEIDKAEAAYTRAIELNERSPVAWRGIGIVHMSRFIKNRDQTTLRDKGLEAWNRSLELNPRQADLIRLVRKYTPERTGPEL